MSVQVLSGTLRRLVLGEFDSIPALRMIRQSAEQIRQRAERMAADLPASIEAGESVVGGGATPDQPLPTWLLAIECDASEVEKSLRTQNPPVIARIEHDRLVFDLRTVFEEEEADLKRGLLRALAVSR
jgi:L-seryl-tRNA(Ser) seleniumtransferase